MKRMTMTALVLLLGCEKTLPNAPSELTTGIVVYEHANYLGDSAHITGDIRDLKSFKGPCERSESSGNPPYSSTVQEWNDCISSVRVAPGWRATFYEHDGFDGDHLDVTEDISNLQLAPGDCSKGGFNDCTTSIRVGRP